MNTKVDKLIALGQVVATFAVVGVGTYFVQQERRNVAESEGHSIARAYAVQLGQVARGIEDMQYCKEKLLPFAEGPGTRVAFSDLKLLGTFLTTVQLTTIEEASNELDRLFPSNYTAPPSGTRAAYKAWASDPVLQSRVQRVDELLGPTLRDLGSVAPRRNHCTRQQLLEREPKPRKPRPRKPRPRKLRAAKHQP
jgi:hypothetical protein